MKQLPAREAIALLRTMTWVLCAVGLLALIFTTVNVTRFATSRDIPLPIAVLLDPMIGTALAGVLYVDARLASWGISPPAWSTALRWGAGCTAALMNSWESLWPDGQIGWPRQADPAAVLLHLTPALLLIVLTETIAAYRRTVTDLMDRVGNTDPPEQHSSPTLSTPRSPLGSTDRGTGHPDPPTASPTRDRTSPEPASISTPATGTGYDRAHTADYTRRHHPLTSSPPQADDAAPDADVWPRAVALHEAALAATGNPVSIWRLRTDLRIGPRRARQIREQLLAQICSPQSPRNGTARPPPDSFRSRDRSDPVQGTFKVDSPIDTARAFYGRTTALSWFDPEVIGPLDFPPEQSVHGRGRPHRAGPTGDP